MIRRRVRLVLLVALLVASISSSQALPCAPAFEDSVGELISSLRAVGLPPELELEPRPIARAEIRVRQHLARLAVQLDERAVVLEALLSIKRAGADGILTYYAKQAAQWLGA